MIEFKAILEDFRSNLWRHHISVPTEIADMFIEGDNRRVICVLNGLVEFKSAIMYKKGGFFILVNKEVRDKLNIGTGDEVAVGLEKDISEYGVEMPDSFQVLLDQDEEGNRLFKQLTLGKQRSLIYIVGKVKNIDSQLNKGMAILDHLREKDGKLDFKQLNEKIKYYNNRGNLLG